MDLKNNIILIKDVIKTKDVETIEFKDRKCYIKFYRSTKEYSYNSDKIVWLRYPKIYEIGNAHVFIHGKKQNGIASFGVFSDGRKKYYALCFQDGRILQCSSQDLEIRNSCLEGKTTNIFEYLKKCSKVNTLGNNENDEENSGILSSIYSKIDFVDQDSVASLYLNTQKNINKHTVSNLIFPFGCNASQCKAVKEALTNQLSIIQGPPGTGKTQTILNIIANLLSLNKTVLVVSNNNSATKNVKDKLEKYGFDFLVAQLGNRKNKEKFIANQPLLNPELKSWSKTTTELKIANNEVNTNLKGIETIFAAQERLAICIQELSEIELEKKHFENENQIEYQNDKNSISSHKILNLLSRIKAYSEIYTGKFNGVWNHLKLFIQKFDLELRLRFIMKIKKVLCADTIPQILKLVELLFYKARIDEITQEINSLNERLVQKNSTEMMKALTENSLSILRASLNQKYQYERSILTSVSEIYNKGKDIMNDYPIVLSTTFSAKTIFNAYTLFDYVIMDEASLVSVETGVLALTCAKNAVIVGDTMQLPNVITKEDAAKLKAIRTDFNISDSYDATCHSFLSSILATRNDAAQTLLKEHYRCHPDIINFCNQKFYGGSLLIMTKRNKPGLPLMAIVTSKGHHTRNQYNQREIDAIKSEVMPKFESHNSIGIIAPYNRQVKELQVQIPEAESATIHKFQGREKDIIIMSTTDDEISEFTDNANLLNVAVSRAKDCFCLVITGNPQKNEGNLHDLLGYINYWQGSIEQSKLRSIYDYLFTNIYDFERSNIKISKYDSENLTYELIENIRQSDPQLCHIKTICHYPLSNLINNISQLSEKEIKYINHPSTHIDFLIINRVSKTALLAIEVDGYTYHNKSTEQYKRDQMKDNILEMIGLPLLRLSTIGHSEEQKIKEALNAHKS